MQLLPQKTQEGEAIYLLDSNIAICESGKILYYDDLGELHDTNFECIFEPINAKSDVEILKQNIIDLEHIVIDFTSIDLVHNTINNVERFHFLNEDVVKFREYRINLETLEIRGEMQELEFFLQNPPKELEAESQEKIKAIVSAVYRENIENFVDFEVLKKILIK